MDAFRSADEVLLNGVQGITDLITTPGLINVDFADVKGIMSGAGTALMGIGSARGEGRAVKAAEMAINSPLLEASMEGAQGVLMSIAGGSDLGLFEINEAASLVQDSAHAEANIIFGTVIDDSLGDEVRVTVIAAGFDANSVNRRAIIIGNATSAAAHAVAEETAAAPAAEAAPALPPPAPSISTTHIIAPATAGHVANSPLFESLEPLKVSARTNGSSPFGDDDDDVDVPPFMRH
jgi:cell division protein FtsZ